MTNTRTSPAAPTPTPAAPAPTKTALELPHDRDQAVNMTNAQPSPVIEQAAQDVKDGLKDTSKHPEMHQTYQKQR